MAEAEPLTQRSKCGEHVLFDEIRVSYQRRPENVFKPLPLPPSPAILWQSTASLEVL